MNTSSATFGARKTSAVSAALLTVPVFVLFAVYWFGLKNWFEQDDFAWLGLHRKVVDAASLLKILFEPMAQGTIRPWSERGFFLLFYRLFEDNALPYHIAVYATQAVNLVLLGLILRKLTGSWLAGLAAPILWTCNSALLTPLCWASDYNQIQCGFFLLLAFLLYLHDRYWLQFFAFLIGFGALELNIVYPAIVLSYVLLCRYSRERVIRTIPLFAVSIVYFALHSWAAPTPATGVYALHFDRALPTTLATYWAWIFAPLNSFQPPLVVIVFTVAVAGFVIYEVRAGRRLALFFLVWFLALLAPTIPLRDHVSDYYLALPVLGIAGILTLALNAVAAPVRWAAVPLIAYYLFVHISLIQFGTHWYVSHTRPVRNLVRGVQQARQLHPGKTIVLTNISDDLYADSIAHSVFAMLEIPDVFLAPELRPIAARLDSGNPDAPGYFLAAGLAVHAYEKENLVVYSAAGERLKNITSRYERTLGQHFAWDENKNLPKRLDVADPLVAYLLGSTWYSPEGTFRWMPSRASFRMGGPRTGDSEFVLSGYCPRDLTAAGPLKLKVEVDGRAISESTISKLETSFSRTCHLPGELIGRETVEVTLSVDRVVEKSKGFPLGLAFGVFEIR